MGRNNTKFNVSTLLRDRLLLNAALGEFVGQRIFPCVAPDGTNEDFIVYYRDEYGIDSTKMGIYSQKATVMMIVVSNKYSRSQHIAELVFETLQGTHNLGIYGEMTINLKDSTEDYIDKKYFQFLLFEII